jgi:hypothetical protein
MALVDYALTDVESVQQYINAAPDGVDDSLIESLINAFSAHAQNFCERKFIKDSYVEFWSGGTMGYNHRGPRKTLRVKNPPINYDPASPDQLQLWDDLDRNFVDPKFRFQIFRDFDVEFIPGIIRLGHHIRFNHGIQNIKFIYPGGLFTDLTDIPPDLKTACEQQVIFWFKNRDNPALIQTSGQIGVNTFFSPTEILPHVRSVLQDYKRFSY